MHSDCNGSDTSWCCLTRVGGSSGALWVPWLTTTMMIPIDCGAFVASLQVRTSLWFVTTAAMSGIMVNVLVFQFNRKMLFLETMKNMCVLYAFNLPMISLFIGVFLTNPLLLFSGTPALVLSFVTLHLIYDEIVH